MPATRHVRIYGGPLDGQARDVPAARLSRYGRQSLDLDGVTYRIARYAGVGRAPDGALVNRRVTVLTHGDPVPYEPRIGADHFADLADA